MGKLILGAVLCPACGGRVPVLPDSQFGICLCGARVENTGAVSTYQHSVTQVPSEEELLDRLRRHWGVLHRYAWSCKLWSQEMAQAWLREWTLRIPASCSCAAHWQKLVEELPPSFDSREAFFAWSVEAHNLVNARLGKPQVSLEEAERANCVLNKRTSEKLAVGFIAMSYNPLGGTETWHQTLLPFFAEEFNLVGMAVAQEISGDVSAIPCPVLHGVQAAHALSEQCDVIILWGVEAARYISPGAPAKVVAVDHGDMRCNWFAEYIVSQNYPWSAVVAINEEVAKFAAEQLSCPVAYIPNAVSPSRVPASRRPEKLVLWAHRIAQEKQPELAFEACLRLPPGWRMAMLGGDWEGPKPDALIAPGVQPPAEWLGRASVFLSTAKFEGFGLSMAEAMLAGVPVVATPCGIGAREELVTRIAVEASPEQVVEAILKAEGELEKAARAKAYVQELHSPERVFVLWKELLSARGVV